MATLSNRRRPSARRAKREQEVLDAAAEIFHRRGYADATVQDVADALGILKGSVYYYIDKKEDLLFAVLEGVHDEVDEILAEVAAEDELAPLERLELYVKRQVAYNLRNLIKITVYYHDVDLLSPERHKEIIKRRKLHERFVTDLIREAQEEGRADRSLDPQVLSNCVFATVVWPYRWYKPRGRFSVNEIANACADFVRHGLTGVAAPR